LRYFDLTAGLLERALGGKRDAGPEAVDEAGHEQDNARLGLGHRED
jgi:hypothetical protein